jgi:NitT/TauT family transport system substrate-binding protein
LILALSVVGCNSTSPSTSPSQGTASQPAGSTEPTPQPSDTPEPAEVTFLTDFGAFGYTSPFYAGVAEGLFADENIDLTIELGQGSGDTVAKVGAGAAQFGLADMLTGMVGIDGGAPITYVASHWQRYVGGLCTLPDRFELNTFSDVEGKKIGATASDAYMVLLPELMRQAGADPNSYEHVVMDSAAATPALLAGQVDLVSAGAVTKATRDAALAEQGEGPLECLLFADEGVTILGHGIIVNNEVLETDRDLAQRFVRAYATAVAWSLANVDAAVAHYIEANPDRDFEPSKGDFENSIEYLHDDAISEGYYYFAASPIDATFEMAEAAYDVAPDPSTVFTNDLVTSLPEALRQGQLP